MNWLLLLTLFYRQGMRLREINNVLKLAFFFPTSIHLSVSLILWDFTPQSLRSPLQWAQLGFEAGRPELPLLTTMHYCPRPQFIHYLLQGILLFNEAG